MSCLHPQNQATGSGGSGRANGLTKHPPIRKQPHESGWDGIFVASSAFLTHTVKSWHKVMDLNLTAPVILTILLLPLLDRAATATDPARIINVGSVAGVSMTMG